MLGDEESLSDVNKPFIPKMEKETSGCSMVGGAEKCVSTPELDDSSQRVGGERTETVPLESAPAEAKREGEDLSENLAAEGNTEVVLDSVAEMNEWRTAMEEEIVEEGGGGMVAAQSEDQPSETNDVEGEAVFTDTGDSPMSPQSSVVAAQVVAVPTAEESSTEMNANQCGDLQSEKKAKEELVRVEGVAVTDTGDAPMFVGSEMGMKVDNLSLVDPISEMKAEEEFLSAVDAKSEMAVTAFEPQIDGRGNEMLVDPQFAAKTDQDLSPVVELNVEAANTDAVNTQQLPVLQTDASGDDLQVYLEGMEALANKYEEHVSDRNNIETAMVDNLIVESYEVQSKLEEIVEGDKGGEGKVNALVNDAEVGTIEKQVDVEEEKFDSVTPEETPVTGAETDVKIVSEVIACVVDTGEQEQVPESSGGLGNRGDAEHDHARENVTSGTKMVEDESMTVEVLGDHMTVADNEDAVVREDLPEGDAKAETEMREKIELPRNVVAYDVQLDAEFETEKGTDKLVDRTSDEDGRIETEETNSDADELGRNLYDSPAAPDEEDETMAVEGENGTQDTEIETEVDITESGKAAGGKRKRAKLSKKSSIPKAARKASSRKTVGEDVCFICFDGGELVLCDRRGCPKAYHPSCVHRDEEFFKSKGRWSCGWHLCSICEKNARHMCYTCTYSLCKSCTKDAVILCVRGNKGFCQICMRTVKLIENDDQGSQDAQVDFDDRSSWEYLFKDYYIQLKAKLSLSSDEIAEAKNPWKGADVSYSPSKQELSEAHDANDRGSGSDDSIENIETIRPKRRRTRKQPKALSLSREEKLVITGVDNSEWASNELLEFVSHVKDGDTSLLSRFDVQALLLEYIKRNKLRDPRRKSQIICDARLENLFGKSRVAHFEMLKLLESHFLVRDEQNDDFQGSVVDTENTQMDGDGNADFQAKGSKDRKRKSRKKGNWGPQSNLDDYAAIDMHNIGLIYLRRKLMEDLLEDPETFRDKVIGTFARIRISGSNQKQDLYRLVQVVGTSKAAEPYKIGKKSTDTMVEILNLDKTEIISIDTISNQEFTEEECKRLRQSIKCGLIRRLTVGEILNKINEIQAARVNDWLESETLRLSHLRDRASDLGHRKELRECVEKLQVLKTPEERLRRLDEIPEIHTDPRMDPSYESDDIDSENEDSRRDAFMRARGINRRPRAPISSGIDGSTKVTISNWESNKYASGSSFSVNASHVGEIVNENSWNSERVKGTDEFIKLEKKSSSSNYEHVERGLLSLPHSESYSSGTSVLTPQSSYSAGAVETAVKINESEKIWHYQDPSGKMQGPFSVVQLRKWNNTGYFPADLRIWRSTEKQENSILLADALEGKFSRESRAVSINTPATNNTLCSSHSSARHSVKPSEISLHQEKSNLDQNHGSHSRLLAEEWHGNDFGNLPYPTPRQSNSGWDAKERGAPSVMTDQTPAINEVLPSPTPVSPYIGTHSSVLSSVVNPNVQAAPFSPTPNAQQGNMLTSPVSEPPAVSPHVMQKHSHPPADMQPMQAASDKNPQGYMWGPANIPQNSSRNFSNPGILPPTGPHPDPWRPPQASQPNMPNPNAMQPNPNVMQPNPNLGWGNLPPSNSASPNWGPPAMQVPMSGKTSNWGVSPPGNVGYVTPRWCAPPVHGPAMGNGWGPPSGNSGGPPPQGNMNPGGSWGSGGGAGDQNHMGGQYSGGRGGQGRDAGYRGGPRPWTRQTSFGGGGFRKGDMVCPYNANGRCRKGMYCDYLHT